MLPRGRCLVVEPEDRRVHGADEPGDLRSIAGPLERRRPRRAGDHGIALREQRPDLLVGLDPRRRHVGVPQHPMGERPVSGRAVVIERQWLAPERQVVERAGFRRLAELPIDQALPERREPRIRAGRQLVGHLAGIVARWRDRQGVTVGR